MTQLYRRKGGDLSATITGNRNAEPAPHWWDAAGLRAAIVGPPSQALLPNQAPVLDASVVAGTVRLAATNNAGAEANNATHYGDFSADGSTIAFSSQASNFEINPSGFTRLYVKDLTTGIVTPGVNGNTGLESTPTYSQDGTMLAFTGQHSLVAGDTNVFKDIYVVDLATKTLTLVSTAADGTPGNHNSSDPFFSPDGNKIGFFSEASNLVPNDTNAFSELFVKDLTTGSVFRVATSVTGTVGFSGFTGRLGDFSPDGTMIAFSSSDVSLVPGDTNGFSDIFLKDLTTGEIRRVSTAADGAQANGDSFNGFFSPDGTKLAFYSKASNLVAGDTNGAFDIFIKDLVTGEITRVSTTADGSQANGLSAGPIFSPDGTMVLFSSEASNLVAGDTNGRHDLFVKNLLTGTITCVSLDDAGQFIGGSASLHDYSFSPDGTRIILTGAQLKQGSTLTQVYIVDLGTERSIYTEGFAAVQVVNRIEVSDDSDNYSGGTLTAEISAGAGAGDALSLAATGLTGNGVELDGADVSVDGVVVGTLSGAGTSLGIALSASADDRAIEALITAIRIGNSSQDPSADVRTVTFTLVDGGGVAGGGQDTASFSRDVQFVPVNDAGLARTDSFALLETGTASGNLLADNGAGADSDVDDALAIAAINGATAAIGSTITLTSGARLTVQADGSFLYDPNGAFNVLPAPGSGASNIVATDSFFYRLAGGGSGVVNLSITGVDSNDTLLGTAGPDTLLGGIGNDILDGLADADMMTGGAGNDRYNVDNVNDIVVEADGDGDDRIISRVNYTLGADVFVERLEAFPNTAAINLTGNGQANTLIGNAGANTLSGGGGADFLDGGLGNDFLFGDDGGDTLLGKNGDDRLEGGGGQDGLAGGIGNDFLAGGADGDFLFGEDGDDTVLGEDGNDHLEGNAGADGLVGGAGDDVVKGGTEGDFLFGGDGGDTLLGEDGDDYLEGNAGSDGLAGGLGDDFINGGGEVDYLFGEDGGDTLLGEDGDDRLDGGAGVDGLVGGAGADFIAGGTEGDYLFGEGGADTLLGEDGADHLDGGLGSDGLVGGAGADTFAFTATLGASNVDYLADFASGSDTLALDDAVFAGLAPGALSASAFVIGTAAADADDRIIYDQATGALLFDADGNGAGAAVQFATLGGAPPLAASDFLVI